MTFNFSETYERPWRIGNSRGPADDNVIVDAKGAEVLGASEWICLDDAARDIIIHAVNAHATLVAALESIAGLEGSYCDRAIEARVLARAALHLAKHGASQVEAG